MSNNKPSNLFEKGNEFYKLAHPGRRRAFAAPADLWEVASSYFDFCIKNPVPTTIFRYKNPIKIYKPQAMSKRGLYGYIGVYDLKDYKKDPAFSDVIQYIDNVIYHHNFTAAAAGLLKGHIVGSTLKMR